MAHEVKTRLPACTVALKLAVHHAMTRNTVSFYTEQQVGLDFNYAYKVISRIFCAIKH